jgi:hypothetical protein
LELPKDQIISLIESQAGGDQAKKAEEELPEKVDHEQHADLLKKFGIDPQEALQKLGGGLGNL